MKIPLLVLFLVAGSSARFDLEHINRALTRIIDNEIQEVSECAQNVLKCTQGNIYPDCLDTEPDVVTINKADIEMDKFFVVDIFNMVLKGTMHLTKTKFHGISEFEMDQVESSVTVVPLGIEFKFRLRWKDDMDFNSRYDLKDVIYAKNVEDTPMKGKGNMNIHMKGIGYEVIAHKILGGKMDYLKITPLIEEFEAHFDEIFLGDKSLQSVVESKFNPEFIKQLDYKKLANYIKDFFNESLYPDTRQTRAIQNKLLQNLSKCLQDYFPK